MRLIFIFSPIIFLFVQSNKRVECAWYFFLQLCFWLSRVRKEGLTPRCGRSSRSLSCCDEGEVTLSQRSMSCSLKEFPLAEMGKGVGMWKGMWGARPWNEKKKNISEKEAKIDSSDRGFFFGKMEKEKNIKMKSFPNFFSEKWENKRKFWKAS